MIRHNSLTVAGAVPESVFTDLTGFPFHPSEIHLLDTRSRTAKIKAIYGESQGITCLM